MPSEALNSAEEACILLEIPCTDRDGEDVYQVKMLREFDQNLLMTPEKIRDLWAEFRQHDVLFSDYTAGKFKPFFVILMDPRGVWMEITKRSDPTRPIGVAYVTAVKPGHEADAHFAFWDSGGRGREPLVLYLAEWVMDRYSLHRLNAAVPAYQHGVIRFIERTGFTKEGVKREAVLYKGERGPLVTFGILRQEVEQHITEIW